MDYISLICISIGLAMDALAVSITNGITIKNIKISTAIKTAFAFGLFQAVMPMIGWLIGKMGESFMSQIDHWIAFGLLLYIGGKMIWDVFFVDKEIKYENSELVRTDISFKVLMALALATSIDALATGIILPSGVGAYDIYLMIISVLIIGTITFIISFIGVFVGKFAGKFGTNKRNKFLDPNFFGGLILIGIGLKILLEHVLVLGV